MNLKMIFKFKILLTKETLDVILIANFQTEGKMMEKKNYSELKFIVLCCLVYFTSYMTRNNYAASIAEIIKDTGVTKAFAGIAVTGSFITYGAGQILSGYIGDKIQPKVIILCGLLTTTLLNFCVGFANNMTAIVTLWCINGFAQSLFWPPLLKLMTARLSESRFRTTCTLVSIAADVATIIIYLIVPLCISLDGWHLVFKVCGAFGAIVTVLWLISSKNFVVEDHHLIGNKENKEEAPTQSAFSVLKESGVIVVMVIIVLQGLLRDGITTWMPSYINDTFNLPTTSSILTTAILPLFAILSLTVTKIFREKNKTEIHTSLWIWALCTVCCAVLLLFYNNQMIISVAMMAVMTACMHGTNLMLIGYLPARFSKYGKVSLLSGLLNACTYVGSAASTYIVALLSDGAGWGTTITIWLVFAAGGLALTFVAIRTTKKLME